MVKTGLGVPGGATFDVKALVELVVVPAALRAVTLQLYAVSGMRPVIVADGVA
jgi:hypothetical protein